MQPTYSWPGSYVAAHAQKTRGWWPGSVCPAHLPDSLSGNHQPWWSSRESNPGPVLKCQAKIRPCRVRCGPLCWLPIFPAVIPSAFRALGCVLLPRDSQQCGSLPFPAGGCRRLFSRRDQAATRLREVLPEMKSIFSTLPVMAVGGFKSLPMTGRFSSHQQALSKPIYPKGCPFFPVFVRKERSRRLRTAPRRGKSRAVRRMLRPSVFCPPTLPDGPRQTKCSESRLR